MPLELLKSERGKNKLHHLGHLYNYRETRKDGKCWWRCEKYMRRQGDGGCPVRILTSGHARDSEILEIKGGKHIDPPNPLSVEKKRVLNNIKEMARNTEAAPKDIIAHSIGCQPEAIAGQICTRNVKRLIQIHKSKKRIATTSDNGAAGARPAIRICTDLDNNQQTGLEAFSQQEMPFTYPGFSSVTSDEFQYETGHSTQADQDEGFYGTSNKEYSIKDFTVAKEPPAEDDEALYGRSIANFLRKLNPKNQRRAKIAFEQVMLGFEE